MNYSITKIIILTLTLVLLSSCKNGIGGDARENPPDPKARIQKNIEEGRGFRLTEDLLKGGSGGSFVFASSNELWRATLDVIDFMPLALANYSGGIVVTDWYSEGKNLNESIKISVRFLTNEVRSDALDIKIFYKKCSSFENCEVIQSSGNLESELKKKILSKAALYAKLNKEKKKKNSTPYVNEKLKTNK